MPALFEQWEKHPEQKNTSPDTKRRYRRVFAAVSNFLSNPDVREVTTGDLQRYVEARMQATDKPLSPRAARDVHKAALSSVYGWAASKQILEETEGTEPEAPVFYLGTSQEGSIKRILYSF